MFVTMNVHSTISDLVDTLMPRGYGSPKMLETRNDDGSVTQRGLIFSLRVTGWYGQETSDSYKEFEVSRWIHFAFVGNVCVWAAIEPQGSSDGICWSSWQGIPPHRWSNTAHHDSAWRHDGFRPLFKLGDEILEELSRQAGKNLSQNDVTISSNTFIGPVFKWVDVTWKRSDFTDELRLKRIEEASAS